MLSSQRLSVNGIDWTCIARSIFRPKQMYDYAAFGVYKAHVTSMVKCV